jgi:hypothetical protein
MILTVSKMNYNPVLIALMDINVQDIAQINVIDEVLGHTTNLYNPAHWILTTKSQNAS